MVKTTARDPSEHRRLIAGARPDLEHLLAAFERQAFGHEGDDVGLGDRLSFADRQRMIPVSLSGEVGRDEEVPRDLGHSFQDEGVPYAPGRDLAGDHGLPLRGEVRAAWRPALRAQNGDFQAQKHHPQR